MNRQETVSALSKAIPKKYLSERNQGGQKITYIAWFDICELLNERVGYGNWQWEVIDIKFETTANKARCYLIGRLTIFCDDGELSMTSTGNEELNCNSFGDPSSNAEAMAMRRCASKFGLGLDLYKKEELAKIKNGTYGQENNQVKTENNYQVKPNNQTNQVRITNPNARVIGTPKR